LELHCCPDRLPGRLEHTQGLVASQFDDPSAARLDCFASQIGERLGQEGGRGVTAFPGESCVAADIGDKEAEESRVRRSSGINHHGPSMPYLGIASINRPPLVGKV
jgi:hypothetical protein